jgi:hypothetical protein
MAVKQATMQQTLLSNGSIDKHASTITENTTILGDTELLGLSRHELLLLEAGN